jgi:hypothetical protein
VAEIAYQVLRGAARRPRPGRGLASSTSTNMLVSTSTIVAPEAMFS